MREERKQFNVARPLGMEVGATQLLESPTWIGSHLWVTEIPAKKLHRLNPYTGQQTTWEFGSEIGSFAPIVGGDEILLARRDGLWAFNPRHGVESERLLAAAPYDQKILRANDGKADPWGNFWFGTYDAEDTRGSLYRFSPGGVLDCVVDGGIGSSNGLAWSRDGRIMYRSDTRAHTVCQAECVGGVPGEWQEFATFGRLGQCNPYGGRPDGAAVDTEDNYWVAMYAGGEVLCLGPRGIIRHRIDVSKYTRCPTMVTHFGRNLDKIAITTAEGMVLEADVEVPGLPVNFAVL